MLSYVVYSVSPESSTPPPLPPLPTYPPTHPSPIPIPIPNFSPAGLAGWLAGWLPTNGPRDQLGKRKGTCGWWERACMQICIHLHLELHLVEIELVVRKYCTE